ncbi:MAG: hypothetical protein WDM78_05755 [Puia sp.]
MVHHAYTQESELVQPGSVSVAVYQVVVSGYTKGSAEFGLIILAEGLHVKSPFPTACNLKCINIADQRIVDGKMMVGLPDTSICFVTESRQPLLFVTIRETDFIPVSLY